MSRDDLLVSIRRTLVPMIVGLVAGSFLGPYVDPDSLEKVVTGLVTAVYYVGLRLLEGRNPAFGVLLGAKKQPTYVAPDA
jgi:uncharacterized membrane protein YfcA